MSFMFEYVLAIDAKQQIKSYEYKDGKSGMNVGMKIAIVNVEADAKTVSKAKKAKRSTI